MGTIERGFGIVDPNEPVSFRDVAHTCAYGDTAIKQFYVDIMRKVSKTRLPQADHYYRFIQPKPRIREAYITFFKEEDGVKLSDVEQVLEATLGRASSHYTNLAPDTARVLKQAQIHMREILKEYRENPKSPSVRDKYL